MHLHHSRETNPLIEWAMVTIQPPGLINVFFFIFSASQIVLQLRQRVPGSRSYLPPEEMIWDSGGGGGPTPLSLRHCVSDRLEQPAEHTVIAKHLPDKFEWIVIKHITHEQVCTVNLLNSGKAPFGLTLVLDISHI